MTLRLLIITMKPANAITLGSVGLVVLLVLLNYEAPPADLSPSSGTQSSEGAVSPLAIVDAEQSSSGASGDSPSRVSPSRTYVSSGAPAAGSEKAQQIQANRQGLHQFLARDEQMLTFEVLADGTELIHMNGTNGHFSAASLDENGEVVVGCHSSIAGLENQGRQATNTTNEEHVR